MTQKYGPFAAGPGFDLGQDDYEDILGPMLQGDGVNTNAFGTSILQVRGNSSGMQVLVAPGTALIRGVMYSSDADVTVTVPAAEASARIDRVVLRLDRNHAGGGQIYPFLIKGTAGAGAPPAIVKDIGDIWDIPLAQVAVGAGVSGINPENVTDERQYIPLQVAVIDSRNTSPYTVPYKVLFDKNPAKFGLWQSDGTNWNRVGGRLPDLNTTVSLLLGTTNVGYGFAVAGFRQADNGHVQCQGYLNFASGGGVFLTGLPAPADGSNHRFTVAIESGSEFAVTSSSGETGAEVGTVQLFANGSLELNIPDQFSGMRIHLDTIQYYGVHS